MGKFSAYTDNELMQSVVEKNSLAFSELYDRYSGMLTNYFYKIVRHPIMLGFLIAFWATPTMTVGHLLFTLVTTAYIFVAVKFLEEKDLKKILGKDYEAYQKRVPMIFPFTKFKKG